MNDDDIRKIARAFKRMSSEDIDRFATMLNEPVPMEQDEIISQVLTAQAQLTQLHGKRSDLANFAGDLTLRALTDIQDDTLIIEDIVVYKRTVRPGMRAKIIVRTTPINGIRWFASIDTWQEGER